MPALESNVLSELSSSVAVPTYDRSGLTAGIVHFGVGGFHRAHQAMYLDRLMNAGQAHDWAICGVGVLPGDARMKEVMDNQDCLYTLAAGILLGAFPAWRNGTSRLVEADDAPHVLQRYREAAENAGRSPH